jgi:hypothetical protein
VNAHFDLTHIARTAEELDKLLGGDDERLFHDMLIGESDIDHVVTRIHEQAARDEEMLLGITERQGAIAARKQRIESRITYSIRLGKPGLKVVDPEAVPEEYQRIKREPDKPKINETFAQSDALPNWVVRTPATDVVTARTR